MQSLRAAVALGVGLSLTVLSLALLTPSPAPIAQAIASAAAGASQPSVRLAEVVIAFDDRGRPAVHALRRSSGSAQTDAAAVREALALADLRKPHDLAGKTVLYTARFEDAPRLD
jgi:hypothetical protein